MGSHEARLAVYVPPISCKRGSRLDTDLDISVSNCTNWLNRFRNIWLEHGLPHATRIFKIVSIVKDLLTDARIELEDDPKRTEQGEFLTAFVNQTQHFGKGVSLAAFSCLATCWA